MITQRQAEELVYARINQRDPYWPDQPEMVVVHVDKHPMGWVVFYDSRLHQETGDFLHAVAGNGPYLVSGEDGALFSIGTAPPMEDRIREAELKLTAYFEGRKNADAFANLELLREELARRLPLHARWFLSMPWEWDFSRARQPLEPLGESDMVGGLPTDKERTLYIFGEESFANGGGANPCIGIERQTGEVHGLDLDLESSPLYLLNSSVSRFIETFLLFDEYFRTPTVSPTELAERLRAIDPEAFDTTWWQKAIAEIRRSKG